MSIVITYRHTRRMSMRIVKNGDVHVSVPIGVPREEVDRFIDKNREWIAKERRKNYERQKQRAEFFNQLQTRTDAQIDDVINRLRTLVEPLAERYARQMGVEPSIIYYRPLISRWGQCNVKDRSICISSYVLLLPEWCVEHIVVHELCHLLEPSHNARFYALMDRYFPRWREARAETRRIYQMENDSSSDDTP